MKHSEKKIARTYDTAGRSREFTDLVYSGVHPEEKKEKLYHMLDQYTVQYEPEPPELHAYIGEMHGHTKLSDGKIEPEEYYTKLRDQLGLDFAALTDHDHGGVGKPELWSEKESAWEKIRTLARENERPGKFTTILAYERDSYPYLNNMILYFDSHNANMVRGIRDGEITYKELKDLKSRDDVIYIPHDTYDLSAGTDLANLPLDVMPNQIEIISRGDAAEYMGNPAFEWKVACRNGFWQEALKRGAKVGCIGGSDDHDGKNGETVPEMGYPLMYPGLTGVWAEENTLEAIFRAIKARRTYAFMGGRMIIDFRINRHYMGEEIKLPKEEDLSVFFEIKADAAIKKVTLVRNQKDYITWFEVQRQQFFIYDRENETDCYYLRVELEGGRFAWTSPIWIETADNVDNTI